MIRVVYTGEDNKYHDKDTRKIFVKGKEYRYSEKRVKELNEATEGAFNVVDGDQVEEVETEELEESEGIDVSKGSYPKKEDLIEAYNPEGVSVQDKREVIEKAIREQND